jgi:Zn-dependent protease with chaperone function
MQLSLLLAIVAAIAVSENAPTQPVSFAEARLVLAVLGIAAVSIFAAASSLTVSRALRSQSTERDQRWWLLWFGRLKQVHQALWLAIGGGILYALDWPQLVRYNWGLNGFLLLEDLLILAPVWVPLLLSWAAFYEVERALQNVNGNENKSTAVVRRFNYVWLQARTHLGLCVLPVLLLLLFQDLVSLVHPTWQDHDYAWVVFLLPVAALTIVFPQVLSTIWKTTSLAEGPLKEHLTRLARQMGVRCRDFRVWHTHGQVMNAAVAGVLPRTRYVFLTDALLEHLDEEELAAVVVHELGHVQRHHLLLRMLLLAMPIWILGCLRVTHPQAEEFLNHAVTVSGTALTATQCLVLPGLVMAYAVIALGRYSRLLEFDADICVYQAGHAPEFVAALWKLSALSGTSTERSTWLHPSSSQRMQRLRRAISEPHQAAQFRRRVNRVNLAVFSAFLGIPALLAFIA